ncbi:MAG TPA: tetratricopeptide repeat protein [Thermohalobaculum sp.]|nr:tetratricopeptide repeat protein [Thermohalobaculum sp.]
MDLRDYFISHNSADMAYAEAINTALRNAGYQTHFDGTDCPPGTNIPIWMNRALADSRQVLALCSPDYFKDQAVFSLMEMMAAVWGDPDGSKARLVPVEIASCTYPPLIATLARIGIKGMTPDAAAAALLKRLAEVEETKRRESLRAAEAVPEVFYVPRPRSPEFSGHFETLGKLHQTLAAGHNAAVSQAIAGLGGIGKTTLAAEYAHRFGTRGRYGGVWWVAAESESGIVQGLGDLAKRLGHPESNDLPAMARWALERLAQQAQPWLLIYDNVPNADGPRYRLPSGETGSWLPQGSARVLITSRVQDFTGLAQVTRLDEWDLATTADYLLRVTGRADREGAEALAAKLGGLPLAADQAAAFLKGRPGIGFAQYGEDLDRLLDRAREPGNRGAYPETVFATLVKSLEVLPQATQDLLCLLAWLSPDGVDESLLIAAAKQTDFLPNPLGAALRDDFARADMIRPALGLSLIKAAEDPVWGQVLILHRVVQAVLRAWQRTEERVGWDVCSAEIIDRAFPGGKVNPRDTPVVWPVCARLSPQVLTLTNHDTFADECNGKLSRLLNQAGLFLMSRGDTHGAIVAFERSAALAERFFGADHPKRCAVLGNLADAYTDAGYLDRAEETHEWVLNVEQNRPSANLPTLAISCLNFGKLYWRRGKYNQAESLIIRAMEINTTTFGKNSVQYSRAAGALGMLYDDWAEQPGEEWRRAEAENLKDEALQIARAMLGERHPDVSHCLSSRAILAERKGDAALAAALELRAVAIMNSLQRLEHWSTQNMVNHLFHCWEQIGQRDKISRLNDVLRPEIEAVEAAMWSWVAKDPENRSFGPPPVRLDVQVKRLGDAQ